jgi:hypothetical protein
MMDDLERALLDAERAEPGSEMRARVLAAAMPLVRADASLLDRVWFSVRWRAAAALSLLALAGVDMVSPGIAGWAPVAQDHVAPNLAKAVAMAAREVGLTPDDTAVLIAQAIEAEGARR